MKALVACAAALSADSSAKGIRTSFLDFPANASYRGRIRSAHNKEVTGMGRITSHEGSLHFVSALRSILLIECSLGQSHPSPFPQTIPTLPQKVWIPTAVGHACPKISQTTYSTLYDVADIPFGTPPSSLRPCQSKVYAPVLLRRVEGGEQDKARRAKIYELYELIQNDKLAQIRHLGWLSRERGR
jgi:hypothetical protein